MKLTLQRLETHLWGAANIPLRIVLLRLAQLLRGLGPASSGAIFDARAPGSAVMDLGSSARTAPSST